MPGGGAAIPLPSSVKLHLSAGKAPTQGFPHWQTEATWEEHRGQKSQDSWVPGSELQAEA